MAKTTDTKTSAKVTGAKGSKASENTEQAGEAAGGNGSSPATSDIQGPQTVDPELAGQKGELDGAIALDPKDVQTEGQAKAFEATTGERPGRGEPEEFIETGPGRVQSTKPNNDPAR